MLLLHGALIQIRTMASLRKNVAAPGAADGDYHERPNFFDVSVYGAPGESVGNYMRRGSRVAIDGRLEWREWDTADQQKRQAVSIVADTVQFLDSPGERPGAGAGEDPDGGELVGVGVDGSEESGF